MRVVALFYLSPYLRNSYNFLLYSGNNWYLIRYYGLYCKIEMTSEGMNLFKKETTPRVAKLGKIAIRIAKLRKEGMAN